MYFVAFAVPTSCGTHFKPRFSAIICPTAAPPKSTKVSAGVGRQYTLFPSGPIPTITTALVNTRLAPASAPPTDAHPIPTRNERRESDEREVSSLRWCESWRVRREWCV